jgi:hypothetical protein
MVSSAGSYVIARESNVVRVDFNRKPDPPGSFQLAKNLNLVGATQVLLHCSKTGISQTIGSRSPCFAASTIFLAMASRTAVGCGVQPGRAQALSKADPSSRVASGSNEPVMGENRSMDGTSTLHKSLRRLTHPNPEERAVLLRVRRHTVNGRLPDRLPATWTRFVRVQGHRHVSFHAHIRGTGTSGFRRAEYQREGRATLCRH